MLSDYSDVFRTKHDACQSDYIPLQGDRRDCRQFVYAFDEDTFGIWLATETKAGLTKRIRTILCKWPAATISQRGEWEVVLLFEPRDRKEGVRFLRSIGACRKPDYDEETLQRKIEEGRDLARRYGFKKSDATVSNPGP